MFLILKIFITSECSLFWKPSQSTRTYLHDKKAFGCNEEEKGELFERSLYKHHYQF